MKRRPRADFRWSWSAVLVLLAACQCFTCWAAQEGSPKDVEAKIEVGVAAAKAEEAMNARQPVKALKLLLDLVKRYPGNVSALHNYYDFLLNHRIKLSDEQRAAALEYARRLWPDVETMEDVFLTVSGEQGIKELFARVADDDAALTRAFTELESAFRDNDLKSLAFHAFVATAQADKVIAGDARLGVGEVLLRTGDYEGAKSEFIEAAPDVFISPELHERAKLGLAQCREELGEIEEAIRDYLWVSQRSASTDAKALAQRRTALLASIAAARKGAGVPTRLKPENRAALEQAIASAGEAARLMEIAAEARATGNYDLAVAALRRIESDYAKQTDAGELTYTLGEVYFESQRFPEARQKFQEYIALRLKDAARRAEAEYLSGLCDWYTGDSRRAAFSMFHFVQNHPSHARAGVALSLATSACMRYAQSQEVSEGERRAFLLELIGRFPETKLAAVAHWELGRLVLTTTKDHGEALGHFEAALDQLPSGEVAFNIGLCHQKLGKLDQAEKWYRRVIAESRSDGPRSQAKRLLETMRRGSAGTETASEEAGDRASVEP